MGLLYYRKIKRTQKRTDFQLYSTNISLKTACILITGFLLFSGFTVFGQESLLEKSITLPRQHTTLYNALNLISEKADCLFIYDSQIVESDKRVKLFADNQSLKLVLDNIIANPEITYRVIGQHILIYNLKKENLKANLPKPLPVVSDSVKNIIVKGHIYDNENKTAIPFENDVAITWFMTGTNSGKIGDFLPTRKSINTTGRTIYRIKNGNIYLDRRIISIQEVIIRYIDPNTIIAKALDQRKINNNREPVYLTSFYREGVQKNKKYISYSEAVFKIYKSPFTQNEYSDQVKLLKSRKIEDPNPKDTVFLKLKAGVQSALQLDIVKYVPDFLDVLSSGNYTFTYSDLISNSSQDLYSITFVQNEGIEEPLFTGTLYIDKESFAILGADFEIKPQFLDKAAEDLILKKSRRLKVNLEKINYTVSYTPFNGKYYLNHTRCDIDLKTRLKRHLTSDNFSTYFEMATVNIDTLNVAKFPKQDIIKPNIVFSDAPFTNDETFWNDYNIIVPEEKLSEALSKIISKIEEIK